MNHASFNGTYSRPPECNSILQSYCLIWVDGVDLLYWPTPYATAGPNATITRPAQVTASVTPAGSGNYPFVTESAYLVYKNARAILPYNVNSTTTGPFFTSLTVPYPAESLSTYYDCAPSIIWPASAINYEDFNRPPRWSVVSQQRPCHLWSIEGDSLQHQTFPPSNVASQYTDYVNKPLVVLPAPLTDIDPTWASCSMGDTGIGLYDPPRAIQPAGALAAPIPPSSLTMADQGPTAVKETAQPASIVSSTVPAQTSVVVRLPNGDTVVAFPPKGAGVVAPSQTGRASSGNSRNFANRPLPFDPNAAASPESQGAGSSNAAQLGKAVFAGSASSAVSMTGISAEPAPTVAVGGHVVQAAPSGGMAIDGVKLNAGTQVTTIGRAQVSLQDSAIMIGGNILSVPQAGAQQSAAPVYLNHHEVQMSTGSSGAHLVVDGQVLPAGTAQAEVGGNLVSVLSNGQISVVPTLLPYVALPGPSTSQAPSGNQQFSPHLLLNGAVSIAGTTLSAGGPGTMVSGTLISVLPNNSGVIIGQKTIKPIPTAPPRLGLVVAGQTLTPIGNGGIAVDGTTLSKSGQRLTLKDGTVASLENGALVFGSHSLLIPQATQASSYQPNALVIDGQTLTRVGSAGIAVDGTTISKPGQCLTLADGAVATLRKGGLVVGTQTIPISRPAQAIGYWVNQAMAGEEMQTLKHGKVIYDGVTLSEGGPAVTLSNGEVISLEASGAGASSSRTLMKGTASPMASKAAITGVAPPMESAAVPAAAETSLPGGPAAAGATQNGTQTGAAMRASSIRDLGWAMLALVATGFIIAG